MRRRVTGLAGIALAVGLVALGLLLLFTAFRRVQTPFQLAGGGMTVQGVVLEKLVEARPDRLLPFDVTTYVVRYAYPNPQGQMRTGEQAVTQGFFERLPGQGALAWVTFDPADPAISAIDPRLTLPGAAGWRAGMGFAALLLAVLIATLSRERLRGTL